MISKVIKHSTRDISFLVDESKAWTKNDKQLISAYLKVHDHEQYLTTSGKELNTETNYINEAIEQARQSLIEVEKQINNLSKFADTFYLADPKKEEKSKQIFDKVDKVYNTTTTYQDLLLELEKKIEKFCVVKSEFLNNLEDFTVWEKFNKVGLKHVQTYEVNSIDIVSFDLEEEAFKDYVSVHKTAKESIFDRADKAIENYNTLILETKIQYATWEELLKRMHLIREIVESTGSTLISSAN